MYVINDNLTEILVDYSTKKYEKCEYFICHTIRVYYIIKVNWRSPQEAEGDALEMR